MSANYTCDRYLPIAGRPDHAEERCDTTAVASVHLGAPSFRVWHACEEHAARAEQAGALVMWFPGAVRS